MKALVWAIFLLALPSVAPAQSFNCAKASSPAEKAICANPGLGKLDVALSAAYASRLKSLSKADQGALKAEQRAWVQVRKACYGNPDCLRPLMADRIAALRAPMRDAGLKPVGTWCARNGQAGLSLLPAGGGLSLSYISFGANGHSCSIMGPLRARGASWSGKPSGCPVTVTGMNGNVMMEVVTEDPGCQANCGARSAISSQQWIATERQPGPPREITMEGNSPCF